MKNPKRLTHERLLEILERIPSVRIAVIGDFFLDHYLLLDRRLEERSVETGKPAHQVTEQSACAGVGGTVINNLSALGVSKLFAIGAIGDDGQGFTLRRCLSDVGCCHDDLISIPEWMTPTYLKPIDKSVAGLEGEHSRLDSKNRKELPSHIESIVIERLNARLPDLDSLIVADQIPSHDGALMTQALRDEICLIGADSNCFVIADSRFHVNQYRQVVTTPNQYELVGNPFPKVNEIVERPQLHVHLRRLVQQTDNCVLCTLGEDGLLLAQPEKEWVEFDALPVRGPIDSTGAGDSFTAGVTAAKCAGANIEEACQIGLLVASITVEQLSTTGTASPAQIIQRHKEWLQRD